MEDEAAMEIEALQSLLVDGELDIVSDGTDGTPPALRVILVPDNSTTGSKKSTNFVGATLRVTYTPKYPEEAPEWKIEGTKGLDPDMTRQLLEIVEEEIQASLGMPMIFTVAEAIRSWLITNNSPPKSMHDEMESSKAEAAAALVSDGADSDEGSGDEPSAAGGSHGLLDKDLSEASKRISKAQFDKWLSELRQIAILKGELEQKIQDKLSGRQLFESDSTLITSDALGGGEDDDTAVVDMTARADVDSLEWQNANLFMEAADDDEIDW